MNVLREYYESKANRELSYYAGRIEDTVISEVSNQHVEISQKLTELTLIQRCLFHLIII